MQKRIVFLIVLNMIIILVSLGIISYLSVNASINKSLENRLALSSIIGQYIDHVLESNLKRLYDISLSGKIDFNDGDWDPERRALKTAYEYSIFTDRIFLMDTFGNVRIAFPHREDERVNLISIPYVRKTLGELKPVISDVYTLSPTQKKVIFALVPLKSKNGDIVGVAGGEIDPTNYMLAQVIRKVHADPDTYIELIDSQGVIIASNDPRRILTCEKQNRFLNTLISDKKDAVLKCHRCKDSYFGSKVERDMLAFSPLAVAPWGISVREPRESVFAPSASLRKGFVILSLVAIFTGVLLAVGLSRGIVRPIHSLISASQKIAGGNLKDSVEVATKDEIGTLGRSFDEMRIRLADSLDSIQRYSTELEHRVAERTKELKQSREKLAVLLREVITAEEEERKRIARELHDDTSQSLNATLIGLDSIIHDLADHNPIRRPLEQIREQSMGMLRGVHRLIKDLRPPVLDDLGLESAIKWVLEKHVGEQGIPFHIDVKGDSEGMKSRFQGVLDYGKIELVLFRLSQEAIINISKHAEAENVFVSLDFGEKGIEMTIEDDGKGFPLDEVLESARKGTFKGLGLLGMEERVALLDGKLTLWSEPGEGTKVSVFVPMGA
ncbi:MAG TPA: HAMP domain-containing protein [Candidatus Deferrimicrobiaceae bacterium]|nr:HAMP domain-containing protein [Candidatus Deferrimicrobiaceae bacterium]